ncbi:hypothetical protein STSP2_00859 [Anaerohalosphaera lusitana]|uniref:Uncharacterized protein n=1 Tax=Anaerohalosphaera lusitana TaxID=1936003 RepID=A0A1U9NIG8_9BACT|nr:hypothetical protein [Anaerohalosphaera lusitana]AQT67711.1 hypothetical protein STSP2_00859 [Anaerohalosphaera lusitana]
MRRMVLVVFCVVTMLCSAGCMDKILAWNEDTTTDLLGRKADLVATLAEIDAVADLKSDDGKYKGFMVIAKRPGLEIPAQERLIKRVYEELYFDDAKGDVLVTLVENTNFSHEAKREIMVGLNNIESEEEKIRVLDAVQFRRIGVNAAMGERMGGAEE